MLKLLATKTMPKKSTKIQETHSHLALTLTDHSVTVGASVNPYLTDRKLRHDRTPLYSCTTTIDFVAVATWPEDRLQHRFNLTVYGDWINHERFVQVLGDRHKRGE